MRYALLVDDFLTFKTLGKNRSPRTAELYRLALSRLATFMGERDPLTATHDDLTLFLGPWLHALGNQATSRRPSVSAVREFFKWAASHGHVPANPAAAIPYPDIGRKLPRVISLNQAEKLLWAPDFSGFRGVRDGAILGLLVGCGLRVSGLCGLNQSAVTTESVDGKPRMFLRVLEKGNRERKLPVPNEADLLLRVYLEHPELKAIDRLLPDGDQVLFVSTSRKDLTPDEYRGEKRRLDRHGVFSLVRKYCRRCGIPDELAHPHSLRHLYGTELAESDVDLIRRQQLMGHADPKSTQIYDHVALRKAVKEIDRGSPLAKMRTPVSDLLKKLQQVKP